MTFKMQSGTTNQVVPPVNNPNLPNITLTLGELPSKGLAYQKSSTISYRPYSFGEIKKISQSKLTIKEKYEFTLSGIECSFDKYQLTVSDFLYISLLRKLSTLGSTKYNVPYICSVCGKKNSHKLEGDQMEFDDILAPELPICVDFQSTSIEFMPLTVAKLFKLIELGHATDELAIMAIQGANTDDEFNRYFDLFNSNSFSFEDGLLLDEIDTHLYHGVKDIKIKCKSSIKIGDNEQICGNNITIALDGGETMILPFRESEEPVKSKLHFGKRMSYKPARPR